MEEANFPYGCHCATPKYDIILEVTATMLFVQLFFRKTANNKNIVKKEAAHQMEFSENVSR